MSSSTYQSSPPPMQRPLGARFASLPTPPSANDSRQEAARINREFAEYYWPRHFEHSSVDPASFIDRIMTDYANYESDVVGEWVENMSPIYVLYRACLKFGVERGTPGKAIEAKRYQGVNTGNQRNSLTC